jgi:tRNA (cytosine34-C5)-methyltransferase
VSVEFYLFIFIMLSQIKCLFVFHFSIRILPHHQDTGGFFVAVLEKTAPLPWEKKEEQKQPEQSTEEKKEPPKKKRRMGGYREDPFVFFSGDTEDVFPSIKEFYDLKEFDSTCLLTRCYVGKKKNIYLVSPLVKDVVQKNESSIKIINTGVKTFVRCDNKNMTCAFR